MTDPQTACEPDETTFAISAVAKMTGVSEHCLRIWERRYGVVEPTRTETKRRRYAREDVDRLALIKRLVDAGDTISAVAPLDLEQLRERATQLTQSAGTPDVGGGGRGAFGPESGSCQGRTRIVLVGERLAATLTPADLSAAGIELAGTFATPGEAIAAGLQADVAVFDFPTLPAELVRAVEDFLSTSGTCRAVIVYGFASTSTLKSVDPVRVTLLRAPVTASELQGACTGFTPSPPPPDVRPGDAGPLPDHDTRPRFTLGQLAHISTVETEVKCECPKHLVSLVFDLKAFEKYSLECESASPEDAQLHRDLNAATAHARAIIEDALARVVEADGIDLP